MVLNYITYIISSKHGNSYVLGKSQETTKTIRKEHVNINEVSGGNYSRKMEKFRGISTDNSNELHRSSVQSGRDSTALL